MAVLNVRGVDIEVSDQGAGLPFFWGHGLVSSMSRRGNCWDNAVVESFFSTLKIELVYAADWATRADARAAVFEYLEVFYNGQRRHSSLGYLSPVAFEQRYEEKALAA